MVELKDKTVEELRKMASKKKIEGRSKMNKAELVRALKKKTSTKKMKGGMNRLPNNVIREIYKYYINCKDFFRYVSKLNKVTLNNINWDNMPEIPIDFAPEVNLNIDCAICSYIENIVNKEKCRIYYNKCRIQDLFNKYMRGQDIGQLVNIGGLTNLLVATIPNTGNMNSVRNDQEFLRRLGVVYNEIGRDTFRNRRLTSVTIPDFVTYIGNSAFSYNLLTEVTIPNSVTYIAESAFSYNRLTEVIIPDSVTHIRNTAFSKNRLTSVTIPDSVTYIGCGAFSINRITSITIPNSVTHIGSSAFFENPLTSVKIPERFKNNINRILGPYFYIRSNVPHMIRNLLKAIQFTFTN